MLFFTMLFLTILMRTGTLGKRILRAVRESSKRLWSRRPPRRDRDQGGEFAFTLRYSRATIAVDARRHGRMAMRVPDPDNQRGHDASDRWANAVEQSD
jgi:hypothetical protein